MTSNTFSALGISPQILAVLDRLQFKIPTPIQHQSIPAGIDGKDIIGIAQTGTGKTLAYAIPAIQRLEGTSGRALILTPTRELALQVEEEVRKIGGSFKMTSAVLIGGESIGKQIAALKRAPRMIIATPGRLLDHLQQRTLKLDEVKILVLDEADRMLDMGFAPQISQILKVVPKERQTLLYSATMPSGIVDIATRHMKLPVRVEVAPAGTAAEKVEQEIVIVKKEFKLALLGLVLKEDTTSVLIFSRTKIGAKRICRYLQGIGYAAAEIHANRTQAQRREALDGFRSERYRILVATDIAARGIDVSHIGLVINFDLPDNSEDYVHRIGRTGRAGRSGKAISFATPDQKRDIRDIERLIRQNLPVKPLPELPEGALPTFAPEPREAGRRDGRRPQSSGRGRPSQGGRGGRPSSDRSESRGNRAPRPDDRRDARPSRSFSSDRAPRENYGNRTERSPGQNRPQRPARTSSGPRPDVDGNRAPKPERASRPPARPRYDQRSDRGNAPQTRVSPNVLPMVENAPIKKRKKVFGLF